MKKYLLSILSILVPLVTFAQENSFTHRVNGLFEKYTSWFHDGVFYKIPFADNFQVPWVLIILIGGAVYFTIYFKLINFTGFRTAIRVVRGNYEDIEEKGADRLYGHEEKAQQNEVIEEIKEEEVHGEVSHFQALATALSATVGLGNIAGVGVAISIGGPGATFWMILSGVLGMATKFAECTLGVAYRDIGPDGTVYGGPMYYLKKGLAQKGMKNFGKILAVIFALLITGGAFGIGNMFQANQASAQFIGLFGWDGSNAGVWIGAVLAITVGLVIVGGVKRIAKVTEKIVPFMAIFYVISALIILGVNFDKIGQAFELIFEGAFSGLGIAGGLVGVMIRGIQRGTFSNEAGLGSAPTAHAAVRTKYPASEGIVALLEPFIDTVIICTMTALVIIIANIDGNIVTYGHEVTKGVLVTADAFDEAIPHFSIMLTIAVILFALSTMISWSYYGVQGWMYLFGRGRRTRMAYNIIFCIFIWIGSVISLDSVIDFSDAMNFAMAVPNIIGVVILASVVRKELKRYREAIRTKHKGLDKGLEDIKKKL